MTGGLSSVALRVSEDDDLMWYYHEEDGQLWRYASAQSRGREEAESGEIESDVMDSNLDVDVILPSEAWFGQ